MLAFGWTIERTKEGEARDVHTCTRRVSQSGQQVRELYFTGLHSTSLPRSFLNYTFFLFLVLVVI